MLRAMSSRTAQPPSQRTPSQRTPRQIEPGDSYPHITQPKQGHIGHLLAFTSVFVVLAFGLWSALGAITGAADKTAIKAPPSLTATQAPAAAPAATAAPTVATAPAATQPPGAQPPVATAAPGAGRVHTVERGDTLTKIAQRYGTTVEAIVAANGIKDRSRISVGDKLKIP